MMAETDRLRTAGMDWMQSQMLYPVCTRISYSVSDCCFPFCSREEVAKYCFSGTDVVLMVSRSRVVIEDGNGNAVAATVNCGDVVSNGERLLSSLQDCADSEAKGVAEDICCKIMTGDIGI